MATTLFTGVPVRDSGVQSSQSLRKRVTFSDVGTTVTVGKIPAGSSVLYGSGVHIVTAFNATTTNVMNIGFIGATTNASAYATALTTTAVGFIVIDEVAATTNLQGTVSHTVTANLSETGAASTAGAADIIINYVANN